MTAQIRVGGNLLGLVPGEVGGSEEYTVGLLTALAESAPPGVELTLFVNDDLAAAHPDLLAAHRVVQAPVPCRRRAVRVLVESTWLAAASRRARLDVMHHTGGTVPPVAPVPTVVTLHDLQPLARPERFRWLKRTYIKAVVPRSLRRARLVITLTDFTGQDAVMRCAVQPSRLRKVPFGVQPAGVGPSPATVAAIRRRHGLEGRRLVLYPAITYPHKNHETLVRALSALVGDRPDVVLVLTGGVGPAEDLLSASIDAYGVRDHVARLGRVPADELDVLYRTAAVMAFPSDYEGFGLPVLEAMARGCPVVASTAGGLPSVTAGAALLVPSFDAHGWAVAIASVLDDEGRARSLIDAGRRRARDFPWSAAVDALVAAYRDAAAHDGGRGAQL